MTLGSFLVVLQLRRADGTPVELMSDLAGLSKTRPGLAAALAIFMFSLAGIPPLLGFWPKFAVFQAAVASGLLWLAIAGFVASVVAAYYYLRLVKIMYFDEPGVAVESEGGIVNGAMIAGAALFCSPLGHAADHPAGGGVGPCRGGAVHGGRLSSARVTHLDEVGSTNDWLLEQAAVLPDGHWVRADRQTAGRGRRGRVWSDGLGNLMTSTLVRAKGPVQQLSFVAAVALRDAILTATNGVQGLSPCPPEALELKWPNDLPAPRQKALRHPA